MLLIQMSLFELLPNASMFYTLCYFFSIGIVDQRDNGPETVTCMHTLFNAELNEKVSCFLIYFAIIYKFKAILFTSLKI